MHSQESNNVPSCSTDEDLACDVRSLLRQLRQVRKSSVDKGTVDALINSSQWNLFLSKIREWLLLCRHSSSTSSSQVLTREMKMALIEGISLLGNCCYINPTLSLQVSDLKICTMILQCTKLNLEVEDFVLPSLRLLGNCAVIKACAYHLIKDDLSGQILIAILSNMEVSEKLQSVMLRLLRNLIAHGSFFVTELARKQCVLHLCRCLNSTHSIAIQEKCLAILSQFCAVKDKANVAEQILMSECLTKFADFIMSTNSTLRSSATQALSVLTRISDCRVALCRTGLIEILADSLPTNAERLLRIILSFCKEAYCRIRIRESGVLATLVDRFACAEPLSSEAVAFSEAFLCFAYDESGLKWLSENRKFISSIVAQIDAYTMKYPGECLLHDAVIPPTDEDEPYRPDSPSYIAAANEACVWNDQMPQNTPLAKDFSSPSGGNATPIRCSLSSSSPAAWSPSYSVRPSPSACSSDSSCSLLDFLPEANSPVGSWSPVPGRVTPEPTQREYSRRHSSTSSGFQDIDDRQVERTAERCLSSCLTLLKFLSHHESFGQCVLVQLHVVRALLNYIGTVQSPLPVAGRALRRVMQVPRFVEDLLDIRFHVLIDNLLCVPKCTRSECPQCVRRKKIGESFLQSFRAQVDSEFGAGLLGHRMSTGTHQALEAAFAAVALVRSSTRKRRIVLGPGRALQLLMADIDKLTTDMSTDRNALVSSCEALRHCVGELPIPLAVRLSEDDTKSCGLTFTASAQDSVCFKCSSTVLYVSRAFLMERCSFYKAMLEGRFSEAQSSELIVHDFSAAAFVAFLHYLHGCRRCPSVQSLSLDDCIDLLGLADRYLMPELAHFVCQTTVPQLLDNDSLERFLILSLMLQGCESLWTLSSRMALKDISKEQFADIVCEIKESGFLSEFLVRLRRLAETHV